MESGVVNSALEELEDIYAYVLVRVGNRADAEDLTQQVALKALPRLREGAPRPAVRGYLYTTARSMLGAFWANRLRLPESELADEMPDPVQPDWSRSSAESSAWLEETLATLPPHYRQVLELRFLQGASIREAAREMRRTEGAIKVLQLRALRAAAGRSTTTPPSRSRPARPPREAVPGSAYEPRLAVPAASAPQR
jgi:RNA polymerase sigma-70 factor (ECF subfamily)